jgi:hypothetical protein
MSLTDRHPNHRPLMHSALARWHAREELDVMVAVLDAMDAMSQAERDAASVQEQAFRKAARNIDWIARTPDFARQMASDPRSRPVAP